MNNVIWHKLSEYDYPQPFREIIILGNSNRMYIGWYEGETRALPWAISYGQYWFSSKNVKAWCELPKIPVDLME